MFIIPVIPLLFDRLSEFPLEIKTLPPIKTSLDIDIPPSNVKEPPEPTPKLFKEFVILIEDAVIFVNIELVIVLVLPTIFDILELVINEFVIVSLDAIRVPLEIRTEPIISRAKFGAVLFIPTLPFVMKILPNV